MRKLENGERHREIQVGISRRFSFRRRLLHRLRSVVGLLLVPAHASNNVLLADYFHSYPDCFNYEILYPIIVVPQLQPFAWDSLSDC